MDRVATPRRHASVEDEARAVWDMHYAALAGYCTGVLADRHRGQDVAAEAFARLWARWGRVDDPRGFLFVVATNLCRDQWRREARERRALQATDLLSVSTTAAPDPWLRDLVERLPERLRVPVLLHYYADLPVAEIARRLRRPEGTVKRLLSEARALLRTAAEETP